MHNVILILFAWWFILTKPAYVVHSYDIIGPFETEQQCDKMRKFVTLSLPTASASACHSDSGE